VSASPASEQASHILGSAMNRQLITTEALSFILASLCGNYGQQSGNRIDYSPNTLVSPYHCHSTNTPHSFLNPLNAELNPICYLLALLGAHHFLHVSRIRIKCLTLRLLMSCIYGAPILDVSRSHTTQHSR